MFNTENEEIEVLEFDMASVVEKCILDLKTLGLAGIEPVFSLSRGDFCLLDSIVDGLQYGKFGDENGTQP